LTPIELAQQILGGKWKHTLAARAACRAGAWAAFAREIAPPRPMLAGRLDHGRCMTLAEGSLTGPVETKLTLVPIWACSDDTVSEWVAVHGVISEDAPLYVREIGPFIGTGDASPRIDACWDCTVRRWKAATVVESRAYAPDIALRLRAGAFGVLDIQIDEVIAVIARESSARPRPTRELPMFSNGYEPRVEVSPALDAEIRAMSFTADLEEA